MADVVDVAVEKKSSTAADESMEEEEESPVEEVRMTVATTDDPSMPVWTFRMWTLGLASVCLLSFFNQFFSYRTEPLVITQITVQVAALPLGHFLARMLPTRRFRVPLLGECSLNPGPFNMKEHVLISIFANAGSAFGNGSAYAVGIVNIIRAFYKRSISFHVAWLLIITTQVLGYGWAGVMRKFVVEPAHMWWPSTLVQVSLFRALHEKDAKGCRSISRAKFFVIALISSFSWYLIPGYFFPMITSISWLCWCFPHSVTAQQIASGMSGLGIGAVTFDWSTVASFLGSPLVTPFFAIANVFIGFSLCVYLSIPLGYWGLNMANSKTFPLYSRKLFADNGQRYDIKSIVNSNFELDLEAYERIGRINLSWFFVMTYGFGFAAIASTLTHVLLFYGKEIRDRFRASYAEKPDIHTKLMKKYEAIPGWWFHSLLAMTFVISAILCTVFKNQVQLPLWGLIFACAMAFFFTLPVSIITATTNQTPGINIITEYMWGLIQPGKPIANVCFKTYGLMSMVQAVTFLSDFKLGHYMKIPPKSMFLVQLVGTVIAATINLAVAFLMLGSIENICDSNLLLANSPWKCPNYEIFYDASVIWGLVGPRRIFGPQGHYDSLNWFFLVGALGPVIVWGFHKRFPEKTWIPLINLPVILGAGSMMPASTINYMSWVAVGTVFNFFVYRYRKRWWKRYNYVLSAALDGGVAFMAVLLYFSLNMENRSINWWGSRDDSVNCPLATCPTAKGVVVEGCPVF
ncbi:oligopeptide transporter 4-like [Zingiber officinale]|uniref:Oligopeptide transporter 4 n=1 Tax=Zingiber officinale TaxID=94328 RepID=A0A8J5EXV2_ZINOF|nr:oligopeptide transporter 4-like [Zingiber officinale]KAG6475641.1 hypothetical protein ZIOFF_064870 [Zingiber officinale]